MNGGVLRGSGRRSSNHSRTRCRMNRRQGSQTGRRQKRRQTSPMLSSNKCPIPSKPSKSTDAPKSWLSSSRPAPIRTCPSTSCRHDRQHSMEPSNAAAQAWRYEFHACADLPLDNDKIAPLVDAFQRIFSHHRPHGARQEKLQPNTAPSAEPTNSPVPYVSSQDSALPVVQFCETLALCNCAKRDSAVDSVVASLRAVAFGLAGRDSHSEPRLA